MRTVSLSTFQTITLNGSGAGAAQVGPVNVREVWHPTIASVACSANVSTGVCQCNIYSGPAALQQYFTDGTFSGDTGDSTDSVQAAEIRLGSYIIAVWSGGVPGATATLTVTGSRDLP